MGVPVQHMLHSPHDPDHVADGCYCNSPSCLVDEDGWTACGERACPVCGSPAVHVTALADGTEHISCECGSVWRT